MTLPVVKVTMPSSLEGVTNGTLPDDQLVIINSAGRLHRQAARAWNALVYDADKVGLPLTFTFGGMYRDYAAQERLFLTRYDQGYVSGGSNKFWNGEWWHLVVGATAATPGTSNHGWGLAIDMAYDSDATDGVYPDDATYIKSHPQWPWLVENVTNYGFTWELQSEPWHIRYVLGDITPQIVIDYERAVTGGDVVPVPTPPPTAPPTKESGAVEVIPQTIRKGSEGGWVKKAQAILTHNFGQDIGTIDGKFGDRTQTAVLNVQRFFNMTADGIIGPKTWGVLFNVAP